MNLRLASPFTCVLLVVVFSSAASLHAAIAFVQGHYYGSQYGANTITQYTPGGSVAGSTTIPASLGNEARGIGFGPDGLLYVVESTGSVFTTSGFNVLAFNSAGVLQQTYTMPSTSIAGNISEGKIVVTGQHIFVAAGNQLVRFNVGSPSSGTAIYTDPDYDIFDVAVLPNGNMVVASDYGLDEITSTGAYVRTFFTGIGFYYDVRGIQYAQATNKLFVTMLGYTGMQFQVMRINFVTGALEKNISFTYADDLFLTQEGNLLVGSRTQAPGIFTQELVQIGTLGTSSKMFVTQNTVPEPASAMLLLVGAALLGRRRQRC